jgi:hypothetical protein
MDSMETMETLDEYRTRLRNAAAQAHGLLERIDSNELDAPPIVRAHFAGAIAALVAAAET